MKVKYLPEPYDCFDFEIEFPCSPPEVKPMSFALGPVEASELHTLLKRAFVDRARQKSCEEEQSDGSGG